MAMGVVWRRRQQRQRHGDGDGGGTERVVVAAQRGRWQWHVEGGRMVWAACHCGWAACWGCEVRTVGAGSMQMGSMGAPGVLSYVSVCWGGTGTAGACWRACAVWGMGKARGGL